MPPQLLCPAGHAAGGLPLAQAMTSVAASVASIEAASGAGPRDGEGIDRA
jgi:hypothetical protein